MVFFIHTCRLTPSDRAEIGRYACQHGIAAAARRYSREFQHSVNESTVRYMKKAYLKVRREKRTAEDDDLRMLPPKKRGRPVLLGEHIERKVQLYLEKVREGGGVVSGKIVVATGRGILMVCVRSRLVENGGHTRLSRFWANSLLSRMNFVQRKTTTAKYKYSASDFSKLQCLQATVPLVCHSHV